MSDKTFADGFIVKRHDKAPDFVTCNISIKADEAVPFIQANQKNGWVNLQVKRAKSGKYYAELDTWEPNGDQKSEPQPAGDFIDNDLPF